MIREHKALRALLALWRCAFDLVLFLTSTELPGVPAAGLADEPGDEDAEDGKTGLADIDELNG